MLRVGLGPDAIKCARKNPPCDVREGSISEGLRWRSVLSVQVIPKHADNENPPNHHNDEQRDDALREIHIFWHCLVPLNPAD